MRITVYGIPNCDTVKKARAWLAEHGVDYTFHDFKKQGLDRATVAGWLARRGRDVLINRKGTTWRALPEAVRDGVTDDAAAIAVMLDSPSVVKRPVLVQGDAVEVGFSPAAYAALFGTSA